MVATLLIVPQKKGGAASLGEENIEIAIAVDIGVAGSPADDRYCQVACQ